MSKKTKRPTSTSSDVSDFWKLTRQEKSGLQSRPPTPRENIMQHIIDFDEGNVTEENVHEIAQIIRETGLHRSAGRYGRFLEWYDNEYLDNDDA